jgi:NAD(P)-dependent dehydrogenase (short-subunit alcohol dehydrogenase family)
MDEERHRERERERRADRKCVVSYVTSKHAVIGITKAAALECAAYRIHVNAVCPGCESHALPLFTNSSANIHTTVIATDLIKNSLSNAEAAAHVNARHPFGGVGKATDIAKAVLFLASPDNTYMTGANLVVDGGYTAL